MRLVAQRGFTLIEVLVAMALFAIMTMIAYMTLGSALNNAELLTQRADRLQSIQRTMRYLGNDLGSALPRPVRDELGTGYLPAIMSSTANDFALAVTHGGWANPAGLPRSTQQRSVYVLQEGVLSRVYFPVLDATYANEAIATELLDGVESIEFRFIQGNGQVVTQWPPVNGAGAAAFRNRPRAVEIVLRLEAEGEIRRIIEVVT